MITKPTISVLRRGGIWAMFFVALMSDVTGGIWAAVFNGMMTVIVTMGALAIGLLVVTFVLSALAGPWSS